VVSEAGCSLSTAALGEVVVVGRLCSQIIATHLSTLSSSVAGGATESGVVGGSVDTLAHVLWLTCERTPPMWPSCVDGLDSTVLSSKGCDFGGDALHDVTAMEKLLIQVTAMQFSTPPCPIAEVVTEGGTADGSTDTLTNCVSTTPACGHGASTFGLDPTVAFEAGCDFGRDVPQKMVPLRDGQSKYLS